ncbi:MAG: efflux RND transporter periplasmic adaptor subunit [Lewinellaceae bacterium]|nr:efflux RND transporter periplasmic adaptor subunit [Lewinellaceae bacterium]
MITTNTWNTVRSTILLLCLLSLVVSCKKEDKPAAGGPRGGGPGGPATVDYAVATPQQFQRGIFATGNLLPNEVVDIRPERAGRLTRVAFREGTSVQKGALLAELDREELEAQLAKLRVNEQFAERELKRAKDLLEIDGIAQEEYDRLATNVSLIRADIRLTEVAIQKTRIFAPFSGRLGLREVSEGAYVSPSDRLVTIQQVNPMKLEFEVPERSIRDLKPGQKVRFQIEGLAQTFTAEVYALSTQVSQSTRTLTVRALAANPNGLLQPGNFARVDLVTSEQSDAILIPTDAIIPVLEGQQVMLMKNGKVTARLVETGTRKENTIVVESGIAPGDTIILSGLLMLKDGMPVVGGNQLDLQKPANL